MSSTLPTGKCRIDWCDQGDRPHTLHEVTVGTWRGESHMPPLRPIDAQVVVHGYTTEDAVPMLVLVDQLVQTDIVLTWDQVHKYAAGIIATAAQFRRLNTPQ